MSAAPAALPPPSNLSALKSNINSDVTEGQCSSSSEGKWYSCPDLNPPFVGCCTTNPCQNGCPAGGLVAATLSKDQAQQAAYAPLVEGSETAVSTSSPSSPSILPGSSKTIALTSAASASGTAPPATQTTSSSSPRPSAVVGAVVGDVFGGIIVSTSIAAFLIF